MGVVPFEDSFVGAVFKKRNPHFIESLGPPKKTHPVFNVNQCQLRCPFLPPTFRGTLMGDYEKQVTLLNTFRTFGYVLFELLLFWAGCLRGQPGYRAPFWDTSSSEGAPVLG